MERIVITGDKNQLPPIDIGRPVSVLYTYLSMKGSAFSLTHMHRAGDASVIGMSSALLRFCSTSMTNTLQQ